MESRQHLYGAHRRMHARPLYTSFHAVHHRSTNPSPWAAFSFHPLEAGTIFAIAFLIPCHPLALLGFMVVMTAITKGKINPRFIVTDITGEEDWTGEDATFQTGQAIYEDYYCARGDMGWERSGHDARSAPAG